MNTWERMTAAWTRANMSVGKLLLLVVLLAACAVIAYGQTVGSDAGNNVTITSTNGTPITTTPSGS